MIPEICGLMLTSLRGSILPVMMVVFWIGDDGGLLDTVLFRSELVVDGLLWLALLPEEHEGSDENQRDNRCDDQFAVLFHNYLVFNFIIGVIGVF